MTIVLFHRGSAMDVDFVRRCDDRSWDGARTTAIRLLHAQGHEEAARRFSELPFEAWDATNHFGDDFWALRLVVGPERYVELKNDAEVPSFRADFRAVANALNDARFSVRFIIATLDTGGGIEPVPPPSLVVSSDAVKRALADAERLIASPGAASAVDRVHTALHGFLRAACERLGVALPRDASLTAAFRELRGQLLGGSLPDPRRNAISKVLMGVATIVDALEPLRNRASNAHPNADFLAEPEAMLVINAVRTILHYVDRKLAGLSSGGQA